MPRVTFEQPDGRRLELDVPVGSSLMTAAVAHKIPGIVAECGGAAACGTCQVSVSAEWASRLPGPGELENSILDDTLPGRRLSCQIRMTPELEGLVVQVPRSQTAV
jgi:ferredoxin, 2Fe-2S